jgi:cytochrome c biogenesis protein CcmG/thiol:disulfide interchange protein DsbE
MIMDETPELSHWVESRLAARAPDPAWEPSALRGLEQFHLRRDRQTSRRRSTFRIAAGTVALCLPLMAIPATRSFAQHCVSACVTESTRIGGLLFSTVPTHSRRIDFAAPAARAAAPDFTLNDATGNAITLSDFRGHVVLLNFWATWCAPCKTEIPWFTAFHHTYQDRGLVVLGVSLDDGGWNQVRPFIDEIQIGYPVMLASKDIAPRYGGLASLPVTLLIDKSGRIAVTHVGLRPEGEYQAAIEALLRE